MSTRRQKTLIRKRLRQQKRDERDPNYPIYKFVYNELASEVHRQLDKDVIYGTAMHEKVLRYVQLHDISIDKEPLNEYQAISYVEYPSGVTYGVIDEDLNDRDAWVKANLEFSNRVETFRYFDEQLHTGRIEASLQARKAQEETEKPFRRAAVHNPRRFKGNFEGL